jgi:hypothetical protein
MDSRRCVVVRSVLAAARTSAARLLDDDRLVERGDWMVGRAAARCGGVSCTACANRPCLGLRARIGWRQGRARSFGAGAHKARVLAASVDRAIAFRCCGTARRPLACTQHLARRNRGPHCGWCRPDQRACEGECQAGRRFAPSHELPPVSSLSHFQRRRGDARPRTWTRAMLCGASMLAAARMTAAGLLEHDRLMDAGDRVRVVLPSCVAARRGRAGAVSAGRPCCPGRAFFDEGMAFPLVAIKAGVGAASSHVPARRPRVSATRRAVTRCRHCHSRHPATVALRACWSGNQHAKARHQADESCSQDPREHPRIRMAHDHLLTSRFSMSAVGECRHAHLTPPPPA